MAELYYWCPMNDQSQTQYVSVMSNATTNGTYISIYTKGSPIASGQKWEVIQWGVGYGRYYMRPQNCVAPPTSVLDMDNGTGKYTHLWEYYPNDNQLFDFYPVTIGGVDYNVIRRSSDGAYLCYEGVNNNDHLFSSATFVSNNLTYWRWHAYTGGRDPGAPKTVSADYIKKHATRLPDRLPGRMPTAAALERLYAAVRKQRLAITGKPAPKLLTDAKPTPPAPPASSEGKAKPPTVKKAKKAVAKKGKKAAAKKPAVKKVKKVSARKPQARKQSKPKEKKASAKKPKKATAKKTPKKAAKKVKK